MIYKFGLIGYPIQHSLSPWIHEQFIEKASLKGTYSIYEISTEESFKAELEMLKKENLQGFNITVPYKETIMNYLDDLDDSAKQIGAVNTVLNNDGQWIGYNTDGIGYVRSLKTKFPQLADAKDKRVLLLGAGGAARGIYYAFMESGFSTIDIANRTVEKASEIIKMNDRDVSSSILTLDEAESALGNYDIIVQTTSVGMKPHKEQTIISLNNVDNRAIVSDIVYQPIKTQFLQNAEKLGCPIHHGHTMLLFQAQLAFEIWTKKQVIVGNMDEQLQKILEG